MDTLGGFLAALHASQGQIELAGGSLADKHRWREVPEIVVAISSTGMTAFPPYCATRRSAVLISVFLLIDPTTGG